MLAFYMPCGNENNIKEYSEKDLLNPHKVEELFDFCQILEGYITKAGWDYLIANYGYEKLDEIAKQSDWFDSDTIEEFIMDIEYKKELGVLLEK